MMINKNSKTTKSGSIHYPKERNNPKILQL